MVAYKLTMITSEVTRISKQASLHLVTDMNRRVLNRAIILTPVDTSNLKAHNKQRIKQTGLLTIGEIFNDANYAAAVHNGTKARVIVPKNKKVLRFEIHGEVVFAKRVKLKARKGRPWLYRALVEVAGRDGWTVTKR